MPLRPPTRPIKEKSRKNFGCHSPTQTAPTVTNHTKFIQLTQVHQAAPNPTKFLRLTHSGACAIIAQTRKNFCLTQYHIFVIMYQRTQVVQAKIDNNMYIIYKLYYAHTSDVYVGITSRTLESRLREHSTRLERGMHHSYKLQTAYNIYGLPEVIVLDTAESKALAEELEIFYIAEYDSFRRGYNCTRGGEAMGAGEDCHSALYTQDDYLCVLAFLAHTNLTRQEIAQECGVSSSVVAHIAQGKNHLYLETLAPEEYQLVRSRNRHAEYFATLDNKYPLIYSPSGEVFKITNVRAFARKHGLDHGCLGKVIRGQRSSHKGWALHKGNNNE